MRTIATTVLLACCLIALTAPASGQNTTGTPATTDSILPIQLQDTTAILYHIETKINLAFQTTLATSSPDSLQAINIQLAQQNSSAIAGLSTYWRAYTHLYLAKFFNQAKLNDSAEKAINQGIDLLASISNKSSEDYALLGYLQSIALSYAGFRTTSLSRQMANNAATALEMAPDNLRANLVAGIDDFHTPAAFGGGRYVEEFLLKAIELPDQHSQSPYAPSWGKPEAYEYLIRYYRNYKRQHDAEKTLAEALGKYPNNYMLLQLKTKKSSR